MSGKENLTDRFIEAFEVLLRQAYVKNKTEFAKAMQITPQKFTEILGRRMHAGIDMVPTLFELYPVRYEYIFFGKMPVLKGEPETSLVIAEDPGSEYTKKNPDKELEKLRKENIELLREISRLKDQVIELLKKEKKGK